MSVSSDDAEMSSIGEEENSNLEAESASEVEDEAEVISVPAEESSEEDEVPEDVEKPNITHKLKPAWYDSDDEIL